MQAVDCIDRLFLLVLPTKDRGRMLRSYDGNGGFTLICSRYRARYARLFFELTIERCAHESRLYKSN
jgi:hypothetical protein